MIINLIKHEIRHLFPENRQMQINDSKYLIHCSLEFSEVLSECFCEKMGKYGMITSKVLLPEDVALPKFTKFFVPDSGWWELVIDMKQGYKIEKNG